MAKRGKFQAKRKMPAWILWVLVAALLSAVVLICRAFPKTSETALATESSADSPYRVTAHLMTNNIQWAEAIISKHTDVHLYLTQQQVEQIVQVLNRIPEGAFAPEAVEPELTVVLQTNAGVIRILYDGQRTGFVLDDLAEKTWSVSDPALQEIFEPIAGLDNTKQWVAYMTVYDLRNVRQNAHMVTWEFFEDFAYWEIGEHKRMLPLEERYYVLAEGDLDGKPVDLYLVDSSNQQSRVDIRSGDVDAFLAQHSQPVQNVPADADSFYSQEQAMIDGCPVMQDGDIIHNQDRWYAFTERTERGEAASITVMHYLRKGSGMENTRYDITFDGDYFTVRITGENQQLTTTYLSLERTEGVFGADMAPYDRYIRYCFRGGRDTGDTVIFEDRIAEPDYSGITAARLILKDSEPDLLAVEEPNQLAGILSLLSNAEYLEIPPDNYLYGTKLILVSGEEEALVLELDLLQGNFRYGMQCYHYGAVEDLLKVLGLKEWPAAVKEEYASYLT